MSKQTRLSLSIIPVDYSHREDKYGDVEYKNVVFVEDFGPFKKGQHFDCITIYISSGHLIASNGDTCEKTLKFKLTPI